jgi:predicted Rossmann fold nucleotide-binding protein DprA/Smf involved in DNA uptake
MSDSVLMKTWEAASLQSGSAGHADSDPILRTGSVTVTGSRDVDRATARHLFEQHLSPLLHQGRIWLVAGARGIDQWAIEWLGEQNESCWAVVPYTLRDQPKSVRLLLEQIERVIELQLPRRKSAGAFRNRYMVDLSRIVFGFWSGKGGSTIKTLRHALRKGREIHGIPVSFPDAPK